LFSTGRKGNRTSETPLGRKRLNGHQSPLGPGRAGQTCSKKRRGKLPRKGEGDMTGVMMILLVTTGV